MFQPQNLASPIMEIVHITKDAFVVYELEYKNKS